MTLTETTTASLFLSMKIISDEFETRPSNAIAYSPFMLAITFLNIIPLILFYTVQYRTYRWNWIRLWRWATKFKISSIPFINYDGDMSENLLPCVEDVLHTFNKATHWWNNFIWKLSEFEIRHYFTYHFPKLNNSIWSSPPRGYISAFQLPRKPYRLTRLLQLTSRW